MFDATSLVTILASQDAFPHPSKSAPFAHKPPRTRTVVWGKRSVILNKGCMFFHSGFWVFFTEIFMTLNTLFWRQYHSLQGQHFKFFHFPLLIFWVSASRLGEYGLVRGREEREVCCFILVFLSRGQRFLEQKQSFFFRVSGSLALK